MDADFERRIATLHMVMAHADLVITWALDSHDRRLFAEWAGNRARYRYLLAHLLEPETS